jgi:hypothetical protein
VLPARLTDEQRRVLVKYARLPRSVTRQEWAAALRAFDLLHAGRVTVAGETLTFQAFYVRWIDTPYASPFIEELLEATDAEADGERLTRAYGQQIMRQLAQRGLVGTSPEVRALLTYCVYWWRSFSKGYIREVAVFRDLEQSGIVFEAHDLRDAARRRSVYDLTVLGRPGDVKPSTYFIHTARAFPLRCDFYIVRLWDERANAWLDLVLLKPEAWRELDGEPTPCTWESILSILPEAAELAVRGETLIIVPYAGWKARVLSRQSTARGSRTWRKSEWTTFPLRSSRECWMIC